MNDTALRFPTQTQTPFNVGLDKHPDAESVRRQYAAQVFTTGLAVAAADVLSITLAAIVTLSRYTQGSFAEHLTTIACVAFVVSVVLLFQCVGLYKPGIHRVYEVRKLLFTIAGASLLAATHLYVAGSTWQIMFCFLPIAAVLVPVTRSFARGLLARHSWWGVRCFVFGADRRIESLYEQHVANATSGLKPIGFLQDSVPADCSKEITACFQGRAHRTSQAAITNGVSCALVHRDDRDDNDIHRFIEQHLQGFARVIIVHDDPRLPSLWSLGAAGHSIEDNLLKSSAQFVKRGIDVTVSVAALVLGFPLFVVLALWIKLTSAGPVFFGHTRIGKDGRYFKAWKFRSMVTNANEVLQKHLDDSPELRAEWEATFKLQNDPRITSAGRFLRKTSLDELPQLWNVLVGEMSLVGPRPIVEDEIERYKDTHRSYMRVRPGITGFWQVSGRNLTTYDRRVQLDEFYVRNWSLWFDLYILCRTVKTVLLREGAF